MGGAAAPPYKPLKGDTTMADDDIILITDADPDGFEANSEALARSGAAFIEYPRLRTLHKDIERCRQLSRLCGEPQCMSLEGQLGAGKTSLVRRYAASFRRQVMGNGDRIPVLYMGLPSEAQITIKGAAQKMLAALGDPAAAKTPLPTVDGRIIKQLQAARTQLVILDDFHHLTPKGRMSMGYEVGDWLKVLIKESGVPFLVVGLEDTIDEIMRANKQLSRLFLAREVLAPFAWDPLDGGTMKEFAAFVKSAEQAIGLPIWPECPHGERLALLHTATDGVVANVMNLLRYCQVEVLTRGGDVVTQWDLARAYAKRLAKHLDRPDNPFGDVPLEPGV